MPKLVSQELAGSVRCQSGHLEVNLTLLRPLQVIPNLTLSVSESHFVLQISHLPNIAQKWFCTQNLHMCLSFQKKKTVKKSVHWFRRYQTNKHLNVFFETPCIFPDMIGYGQIWIDLTNYD